MNHKLENIAISNLNELERKINQGSRFVVFNYRVSLGLISLLRLSPAIFIREKSEMDKFIKKYNTLNFIFGPWYIFKGPWLTYDAYKVNKLGGIDVTKDIMLNITEQSLIDNEVIIENLHDIFLKLKETDKQNIKKAMAAIDKKIMTIEKAYAGLFINTAEYEEPYFVIGCTISKNAPINEVYLKKILYKYYYKHVRFEFIDLQIEAELGKLLIEQGDLVYGN